MTYVGSSLCQYQHHLAAWRASHPARTRAEPSPSRVGRVCCAGELLHGNAQETPRDAHLLPCEDGVWGRDVYNADEGFTHVHPKVQVSLHGVGENMDEFTTHRILGRPRKSGPMSSSSSSSTPLMSK